MNEVNIRRMLDESAIRVTKAFEISGMGFILQSKALFVKQKCQISKTHLNCFVSF